MLLSLLIDPTPGIIVPPATGLFSLYTQASAGQLFSDAAATDTTSSGESTYVLKDTTHSFIQPDTARQSPYNVDYLNMVSDIYYSDSLGAHLNGVADFEVELDVIFRDFSSKTFLAFGRGPGTGGGYLSFQKLSNNQMRIRLWKENNASLEDQVSGGTFTVGPRYKIVIRFKGGLCKVFVDDVEVISGPFDITGKTYAFDNISVGGEYRNGSYFNPIKMDLYSMFIRDPSPV